MNRVYLISLANGEQAWAKGNGSNPTLRLVWASIRRGDPLRCNRERPVNRYALAEADYGVPVIFNPAYVTDVAEFPVYR